MRAFVPWIGLVALAAGACERERPVFRSTRRVPEVVVETGAIHVGVLVAASGRDAASGVSAWRGALLSAEERNAGARVQGREVQLSVLDDGGRAPAAALAGRRFATTDAVALVLSDASRSRAEDVARAAHPLPVLSAAWPYAYSDPTTPVVGTGANDAALARACASGEVVREIASGDGRCEILLWSAGATERARADALHAALSDRFGAARVAVRAETLASFPARLAAWTADAPALVVVADDGFDASYAIGAARQRGVTRTRFVVVGEPDLASVPSAARHLLDGTLVLSTFDRSAAGDFPARFRARFDAEPDERAWRSYRNAEAAWSALDLVPAFWPKDVRAGLALRAVPRATFTWLTCRDGRLLPFPAPTN